MHVPGLSPVYARYVSDRRSVYFVIRFLIRRIAPTGRCAMRFAARSAALGPRSSFITRSLSKPCDRYRLKNAARLSCGFDGCTRLGFMRVMLSIFCTAKRVTCAPIASSACRPFCVWVITSESPVSSSRSGQIVSAPHRSASVISAACRFPRSWPHSWQDGRRYKFCRNPYRYGSVVCVPVCVSPFSNVATTEKFFQPRRLSRNA